MNKLAKPQKYKIKVIADIYYKEQIITVAGYNKQLAQTIALKNVQAGTIPVEGKEYEFDSQELN